MKKTILSIALAVSSVFAFAQTNADVVGEWYNAEKMQLLHFMKMAPQFQVKLLG